ncbi:TrkH family potassium uptake protein [Solicola gregarius]|uniref:TrkH family potassium uptake protein n=1 Tax=Solicola gregarius TaxID=2908642 RepID=A0AA46TMX6_9ACTN|nr:potassium transporter TrkG [Solicola gregarius]UYM07892.1 TrkH family potassium uptake protein [Solicola gregarius]
MVWSRRSLVATVMHPVRLLPLAFVVGIVVGGLILMLPISRTGDSDEVVMPALFASTSAVTVTGLTTVDTAEFWTPFGQVVLMVLVQIGGFGIMTLATVLGLLVGGRLGLRTRLMAQAEMHIVNLGEVWPLLRRVAVTMFSFEIVIAIVLAIRFRIAYFDDWGTSAWYASFHSVMAFNNAGFSLNSDSLVGYLGDAWLIFPLCIGVFAGAVGFPVMAELFKSWRRPAKWTIHTRLTVWGSIALFVAGTIAFLALEWNNPGTLGPHGWWDKVVTGIEGGIMPRSGGFNSIDYAVARPETQGVTDIMMFIGGGSASTAGGIKVTTFLLLAYVILAELRGDPDVMIGHRRIGTQTLRQAVAIALLSVMLVAGATLFVLLATDFSLEAVLFECTSAFGTVGLSMGITGDLPYTAQVGLMLLMFVGRVGTITAASALTMRQRIPRYRLPEERPIIG